MISFIILTNTLVYSYRVSCMISAADCKRSDGGREYLGNKATSKFGQACLPWTSTAGITFNQQYILC